MGFYSNNKNIHHVSLQDNIISNLSEDILTRDDKISILENHINHLEDEIRRLQCNLADVIDTGESIKDNSFLQMDQSLKTMEAHRNNIFQNIFSMNISMDIYIKNKFTSSRF